MEGNKVIEAFYAEISQQQFDQASLFFGKYISIDEGRKLLLNAQKYLGNFRFYQVNSSKSEIQFRNEVRLGRFDYEVTVFYEKGSSKEEIVLEIINGKLKITGYHSK